jgi:hypothetical protein
VAGTHQALHTKEEEHSPLGDPSLLVVGSYDIDDLVPTEEEVAMAVKDYIWGKPQARMGSEQRTSGRVIRKPILWSSLSPSEDAMIPDPIPERWDALVATTQCMWSTGKIPIGINLVNPRSYSQRWG